MTGSSVASPADVLVVCLCAEWCGVCRDYQARFEQLQSKFPHARFMWIDVEDQADLLHPLDDVDNFPTLLLAVGDEPHFFGPVTPEAATLERLIKAQIHSADAAVQSDREVADLVRRIRASEPA